MSTYNYGNLLVVDAHSFTDGPEILRLTHSTDVKLINLIRTQEQDGLLLYEVLALAMHKVAPQAPTPLRIYQLSGTPTSSAYRARNDFVRALTLNRDDFLDLITAVHKVDLVDQIESLLQRSQTLLRQIGAEVKDFAACVRPVKQAITTLRREHYDRNLEHLATHLANQW